MSGLFWYFQNLMSLLLILDVVMDFRSTLDAFVDLLSYKRVCDA